MTAEAQQPLPDQPPIAPVTVEVPDHPPPNPEEEEAAKAEPETNVEDKAPIEKNPSFREESNHLADLKDHEKKALVDFKSKLEEAILANNLLLKKTTAVAAEDKEGSKENNDLEEKKEDGSTEEIIVAATAAAVDKEISLWGVPLLPSKASESTDVVILKFLRAREFKVKESFEMLQKTLSWRKEQGVDDTGLGDDEKPFGEDLAAACYMDGVDREGHPVCFNVYGVFQDEELYKKVFGNEELRGRFLRWRMRLMEKGIEKLDFKPGGISSLLQVTDLRNSPGPAKKELRNTMKQVVELLQDNYPELVAKNIFVNVPFWYYAFNAILSPFLTQRTRSKFVFARPANVTDTLLKYIPAEDIPVSYGGLKRENDAEFSVQDGGVKEVIVKSGSAENIEIPAPEVGTTLIWDLTVLGWEVNYKEEFVPTDEGSYTIIILKGKKMGFQETAVRNSFRSSEPGNVVLTIENPTFKKKKVLFRYKVKSNNS